MSHIKVNLQMGPLLGQFQVQTQMVEVPGSWPTVFAALITSLQQSYQQMAATEPPRAFLLTLDVLRAMGAEGLKNAPKIELVRSLSNGHLPARSME